ncbi:hypothetical protein MAIT1_02458 [Magnetofaba australis IT-1]|uniref:HEAT repeat domain-containing protein n=1 Tax=Magnetofaba australis IT-1 TaxID=1434232 RepID=A0A1Y2K303_9PROT|nr:hypothetical protein MAIT1_02458 [Magnetofaba australis IT-1]
MDAPELLARYQIKAAPWIQLGEFIFAGEMPAAQWREWTQTHANPKGRAIYLEHLFTSGQRALAEQLCRENPAMLLALGDLLADEEVDVNGRLGIMVVLEELRGTDLAQPLASALLPLVSHPSPRIRGDAATALGLTGSPIALPPLLALAGDADAQVREVAADALEELRETLSEA